MLHYRHKLNSVKSVIFNILQNVSRDLFKSRLAVMSVSKRLDRDLTDRKRARILIKLSALRHPLLIRPRNRSRLINYRNNTVFTLRLSRIRIWSLKHKTTSCLYLELIAVIFFCSRDKYLKNTDRIEPSHLAKTSVPIIEISDNTHPGCRRCPDSKLRSVHTSAPHRMSSEFFIDMIMNSASKLDKIFALKKRFERIRIYNGSLATANTLNDKFVF